MNALAIGILIGMMVTVFLAVPLALVVASWIVNAAHKKEHDV